jgi:hypothetical protein
MILTIYVICSLFGLMVLTVKLRHARVEVRQLQWDLDNCTDVIQSWLFTVPIEELTAFTIQTEQPDMATGGRE